MSHLPCKQDPPFTLPTHTHTHTHTQRKKEKCPANTSPACEKGEVSVVRVYTFSIAHALHITYNRFCEIPRTTGLTLSTTPSPPPPPPPPPPHAKPNRQSLEKGRASYYFHRTPRDKTSPKPSLGLRFPLPSSAPGTGLGTADAEIPRPPRWQPPTAIKDSLCSAWWSCRVQELCESRGGRPGPSVLTSLMVYVDVMQHWIMHTHWSQFVPNMSTRHPRTLSSTSSSSAWRSELRSCVKVEVAVLGSRP